MADTVEAVRQAQSVDDVAAHAGRLVKALGFDTYIYYRFASPQAGESATFRTNCLTDFFTRYERENYYQHDFVGHYACQASLPFVWDDTPHYGSMTPLQQRVLDDVRSSGFRHGATVPLADASGRRIAFAIGNEMDEGDFRDLFTSTKGELFLIGSIVHDRIVGLSQQDARQTAPLTPRETEVLGWTAKGKSEADIAAILSISAHTVAQHIARCRAKLNATNKTHAVVKALQRDLIGF